MNTLMEVEQLATVMGMVRAGLGISVVPSLTLAAQALYQLMLLQRPSNVA